MESPPSSKSSGITSPKLSGLNNLLRNGKISEGKISICSKSITRNQKDGASLSRSMPFSLVSKNFNRPSNAILTSSRSPKEVSLLINMCFHNWWKIMGTWMKANIKFSSVFTAVFSPWRLRKKPKSFTWNAHLKNAMKGPWPEKDHKKMKFHLNTSKRFMSSMKIGSRTTTQREFWYWIQLKILEMMKRKFSPWFKSWKFSLTVEPWSCWFIHFYFILFFICFFYWKNRKVVRSVRIWVHEWIQYAKWTLLLKIRTIPLPTRIYIDQNGHRSDLLS